MSERIVYPHIPHGPEGLVVERFGAKDISELLALAPAIVDLAARSYTRQLEAPNGPLEPGMVQREYTVAAKQEAQEGRIKRILGAGGAYYIVRSPEDPATLDGLANFKPMADTDGWYDYVTEHSYITDVLADPPQKGIGSAALHATLADNPGYRYEAVHLDGFTGSSVNTWYEKIGFEDGGASNGWELAGTAVPTTRYTAAPVSYVLAQLEAAHPGLATRS